MPDARKMNRLYNDNYYAYLQSETFKCIYEYAARRIVDTGAKRVLDVGCWTGMFAEALLSCGFNGDYLGTDISDAALCEPREKYKTDQRLQFIQHDFTTDVQVGHYDSIYFGGIFYYIEDRKSFFKKFAEECEPSVIVIQDLSSTDLSFLADIKCVEKDVKEFNLQLNAHGSTSRNARQVHTIKLSGRQS